MSTYDLTSAIPSKIKKGDILNCPYSGVVKSITLSKGTYKLECWGAQGGGSKGSTSAGGKGGYSVGVLVLTDSTTLYCYVGGQGKTGSQFVSGGFNGGGNGSYNGGGSGGGASDIRLKSDNLYSRVIVAGGGGGDGYLNTPVNGGYGGGTTGGNGDGYSTSYNYGANGGESNKGGSGNGYSTNLGKDGTFGTGGNATSASSKYNRSGGGGAGWYGGGAAGYRGSSSVYPRYVGGGGGGSGYVYTSTTASNYPSGCLLNSAYYLTDASTIAGNTAFTSPTGTSETGHSGDGYIRITAIEVPTVTFRVKKDSQIITSSEGRVKVSGVWKPIVAQYVKVNGVWKLGV